MNPRRSGRQTRWPTTVVEREDDRGASMIGALERLLNNTMLTGHREIGSRGGHARQSARTAGSSQEKAPVGVTFQQKVGNG
jgi:hypothetical protein